MANFMRGLTSGFQTGLQFGEKLRQRQMEDELAKAYAKPETSQGYTAEDGQRMEEYAKSGAYDIVPQYAPAAEGQTQGVFTGYLAVPKVGVDSPGSTPLAPIAFNPQQVQDYGGQRVSGQFNPEQLRGLQMREAARVLGSYGDVRGAAALEAQAAEQEYQAKYRPLQLKQLEGSIAGQAQQQELTGIQLTSAKRKETEQQNAANFAAFAAENPNATTQELKDAAFKQFKFTPAQWQEAVNIRLGISDTEQKIFVSGIKDKLKGKNLQQLGALYNSDPDFDDKTDLAIVPGKNGAVTLNFIDKATNKVTSSQTFSSEALATEYLNKQATQPEIIGTWMLNLRKVEADIDQSKASAERSRSLARREDAARGLTQAQEDYQKKLDGVFEGYQSAMALGPQGRQAAAIYAREYDQLRANVPKGLRAPPSIAAMNEAQRAEKPEKPVKVEEAGVQYKVGGKVVQTDGMGGFMSPKGVLPDDRPKALRAAGVSDNNASRVMWSNDGETVMFNGEEYDVRNKRDMAKLNKDMEEYDVLNARIAQENKLRGNPTAPSGFQGARTTGLGPASSYGAPVGAPSIYGR
jgi:hypothetical protein